MSEQSPKKKYPFSKESDDSAAILCNWWKSLGDNRGERAALKRARSPGEVVFSPAYHRFLGQLQQEGYTVYREALAVMAGLVAHVEKDIGSGGSLAKQMASPKAGGTGARVSGLRFRRLLAVNERKKMYPLMIRIICLLDGKVNLVSLANAVYWWNENARKQWAYDYYATAPAEK